MKKPIVNGLAFPKMLYKDINRNIKPIPLKNNNFTHIYGVPAIIPGLPYPLTEREERIAHLSYMHGVFLTERSWDDE